MSVESGRIGLPRNIKTGAQLVAYWREREHARDLEATLVAQQKPLPISSFDAYWADCEAMADSVLRREEQAALSSTSSISAYRWGATACWTTTTTILLFSNDLAAIECLGIFAGFIASMSLARAARR